MSSQPHESGIHAVWPGAGEASVTEVPFPAGTAADGEARADHDQLRLSGILFQRRVCHLLSAVDVRVADVTLIGLFQLGRTRRLHVVADRSELELAEVQRFLLPGAQHPALR
jgi:hypothetical protein